MPKPEIFLIEIAFGQYRGTFAGFNLQLRLDLGSPGCSLKRIPHIEVGSPDRREQIGDRRGNRMQSATFELLGGALFYCEEGC